MKYAALIALFAVACFAEDLSKPACNASIAGQFWPEEANSNREAVRRLFQLGELEMCVKTAWKYRWEQVSVNVRDLGKGKHRLTLDSTEATADGRGTAVIKRLD